MMIEKMIKSCLSARLGRFALISLIGIGLSLLAPGLNGTKGAAIAQKDDNMITELPQPETSSRTSLEKSLEKRRSVRQYADKALKQEHAGQLLWAAQGITHSRGFRTAPSAGALYPLEIYAVTENMESLEPGIYHYSPAKHELKLLKNGDHRKALCRAGLSQSAICNAPLSLVITGVKERTTGKYGERGIPYVFMEAGHAAQNVLLQAVSLDLGAVPIGAFRDSAVSRLLELPEGEQPLYIIPIGHPAVD